MRLEIDCIICKMKQSLVIYSFDGLIVLFGVNRLVLQSTNFLSKLQESSRTTKVCYWPTGQLYLKKYMFIG
jgi:hypothetical protein